MMEKLFIPGSKSTPEVDFDPEKGTLLIKGESYPENSYKFYKPLFQLVQDYLETTDKLEVNVKVHYLNTSSTKSFMNLLDILEDNYLKGKEIILNWYYEEDNEHSYELVEEFKDYLELPIKVIAEDQII